jgi:hypothetical protein
MAFFLLCFNIDSFALTERYGSRSAEGKSVVTGFPLAKRGERGRFGRSNGNDDESTGGLWKVNMRDIQYGRNEEYSRILFVKKWFLLCVK